MAARKVLMVAPASARQVVSNPETATDNFFQQRENSAEAETISVAVKKEFDGLAELLNKAGIEVNIFLQDDGQETPDAVFPNNWFSTFPGGTVILYPMMAQNRRLERRPSIV